MYIYNVGNIGVQSQWPGNNSSDVFSAKKKNGFIKVLGQDPWAERALPGS